MTTEEQQVAIVEACPDLFYFHHGKVVIHTKNPRYIYGPPQEVDPLTDLNAMHEAEKVFFTEEGPNLETYADNLERVCFVERNNISYDSYLAGVGWGHVEWIHATAAQRAEAFCRTLWPERFK